MRAWAGENATERRSESRGAEDRHGRPTVVDQRSASGRLIDNAMGDTAQNPTICRGPRPLWQKQDLSRIRSAFLSADARQERVRDNVAHLSIARSVHLPKSTSQSIPNRR